MLFDLITLEELLKYNVITLPSIYTGQGAALPLACKAEMLFLSVHRAQQKCRHKSLNQTEERGQWRRLVALHNPIEPDRPPPGRPTKRFELPNARGCR